jgi:hypothetical protein
MNVLLDPLQRKSLVEETHVPFRGRDFRGTGESEHSNISATRVQMQGLLTVGTVVYPSENRKKHFDGALRDELDSSLYIDVPGFFDTFFGDVANLTSVADVIFRKCQGGKDPLYIEEGGWRDWPKDAKEDQVLKWLKELVDRFLEFAKGSEPIPNLIPGQGSPAYLDTGHLPICLLDFRCREQFHCAFPSLAIVPPRLDVRHYLHCGAEFLRRYIVSQIKKSLCHVSEPRHWIRMGVLFHLTRWAFWQEWLTGVRGV